MRLIDADALDGTFSRLNDDGWQLTRGDHKRVEAVLFEMPTIDAVPVVRCKDCKYYMDSNEKCELVDTRLRFYSTNKRWTNESYCSWGEGKDGAE